MANALRMDEHLQDQMIEDYEFLRASGCSQEIACNRLGTNVPSMTRRFERRGRNLP